MIAAAQASSTPIFVAVVTGTSVVLVALISMWAGHRSTAKKVEAIEFSVNHADEQPVNGVPHTLGQRITAGFARNDAQNASVLRVLDAHGELLHAHSALLDTLSDRRAADRKRAPDRRKT